MSPGVELGRAVRERDIGINSGVVALPLPDSDTVMAEINSGVQESPYIEEVDDPLLGPQYTAPLPLALPAQNNLFTWSNNKETPLKGKVGHSTSRKNQLIREQQKYSAYLKDARPSRASKKSTNQRLFEKSPATEPQKAITWDNPYTTDVGIVDEPVLSPQYTASLPPALLAQNDLGTWSNNKKSILKSRYSPYIKDVVKKSPAAEPQKAITWEAPPKAKKPPSLPKAKKPPSLLVNKRILRDRNKTKLNKKYISPYIVPKRAALKVQVLDENLTREIVDRPKKNLKRARATESNIPALARNKEPRKKKEKGLW